MMGQVVRWIDHRALPRVGPDVHVYDFGQISQVILFRDRLIEAQDNFPSLSDARLYGRRLADRNRCALIEHSCTVRA